MMIMVGQGDDTIMRDLDESYFYLQAKTYKRFCQMFSTLMNDYGLAAFDTVGYSLDDAEVEEFDFLEDAYVNINQHGADYETQN